MTYRIPNCCAMPLNSKVGDTYVCITCGTTYRHLLSGWALAGPIVDLAPELLSPDPIDYPYETTLDTNERTGN